MRKIMRILYPYQWILSRSCCDSAGDSWTGMVILEGRISKILGRSESQPSKHFLPGVSQVSPPNLHLGSDISQGRQLYGITCVIHLKSFALANGIQAHM